MRAFPLLALSTLVSSAVMPGPASAQVVVVEEGQAATGVVVVEEGQASPTPVVERGYVRGTGRGIQYGAHIISPVYLTTVRPPGSSALEVGAGAGLHARIGWEFPSGITIEILGGFAVNAIGATPGVTDEMSSVLTRAEVGGGLRYMFFNDTAFVPFVQVGGTVRWFWFDYWDEASRRVVSQNEDEATGAIHGVVGAQIELTPYFGIEAGVAVDYTFWGELFDEGFVTLMPFLGVTLYAYDESGN